MSDCPFCLDNWIHLQILDRNATGSIAAIKPLHPVTPGHIVVIHAKHTESASEDPEQAGYLVAFAAKYVARHNIEANIITSIGSDASQTVFHTHVDVVPRTAGDGLMLPWSAAAEEPPKRKRRAS